jgi:DNA-binding response OmpR family regulator
MTPTPVAQNIIVPARQALALLRKSVQESHTFDPLTAEKAFNFASRDLLEVSIMPRLVSRLQNLAPNISLTNYEIPRSQIVSAMASGTLDFFADASTFSDPHLCKEKIAQDRFVVLARKNHPALKNGLDLDTFLRLGHINVSQRKSGAGPIDVALDRNIHYEFKTDVTKSYLWFDKNQLEKVIFNLISNAFKFTNDKGNIQVCIEEYDNEVIVLVKDDGIGLSPENQKKIFKRFYQVKYEHSEKNKGFGLGLSIAKEIVELHKAKIKVISKLNKGSTFEIKLLKGHNHFENIPENNNNFNDSRQSIDSIQQKLNRENQKTKTILIVEDNIEIQDYLKELLEAKNYTIIQAFSGVEGLQLVTKFHPNLIISDVMMPKMDGIEFTSKVKSNSTTSHIPIIILTAKTALEDKTIGYNKGADAYISKPFDEELLITRIENLLKSRKILQSKFSKNETLNPKEININSKDQELLEKLYKCLEENLETNNLKSDFISKQMNMSHSSLYKKIKSLTGLTYIEFIRDYRLSVAKQLIQENGYAVSDACFKVGYSDRKYFSKLFKNKFKNNPSFYLKS